jgi:hypothetical protein
VLVAGFLTLSAYLGYHAVNPRVGSPAFFLFVTAASTAYVALMVRLFAGRTEPAGSFVVAGLLLAAAFRVPFLLAEPGDDVYRYLWDARVQRLGYNPYLVVPADPKLANLHTDETRRINHPELPTPYPPAAQLFFRCAFAFSDKARAIKVALALVEALLAFVLWLWLRASGQRRALILAYAWNPLVILVTAGEGHIDVLGVLWLLSSALLLAKGRRLLSMLSFALALATKPVPLVLLPLYWRRIRLRDAAAAVALLAALYVPYLSGATLPIGSLGVFAVQYRFNQTMFALVRVLFGPQVGVISALGAGLAIAVVCRNRLRVTDAAAWAWPTATAFLMSPVVYPWYLVWLAPFFTTLATLPLLAWSIGILSTYVVWYRSDLGDPWRVPAAALVLEFGALVIAGAWVILRARQKSA